MRLPQLSRCPAGLTTETVSARTEAARGLRRALRRRTAPAGAAPRAADESSSTSSARWASRATSSSSPTSSAGRASNGVPVGPGRGSGAGSLVAYALGITDLDPLALRPAVRALPESGARVDARLRHRLLHGRARPRHRVRARRSTAASASRRSSPTAPWPRRRWCATSAACSA